MERINPVLLKQLQTVLGLSQRGTYARIERRATRDALPTHLAALNEAREEGISITRFASPEDLAALRGLASREPETPASIRVMGTPVKAQASRKNRKAKKSPKRKGNSVFVVHGRNEELRKAMFQFLRAAGLQPIEWSKAISMTGKASPYVGEILEVAFSRAQAVVALFTPDDEAKLKDEFRGPNDPAYERKLTGQARPNVLFEAGMAFGTHPNQTVLVEVGKLRPFSDTGGRHAVHLNNSTAKRHELMIKLNNAGCDVDFKSTDWQTEGDFSLPPKKKA